MATGNTSGRSANAGSWSASMMTPLASPDGDCLTVSPWVRTALSSRTVGVGLRGVVRDVRVAGEALDRFCEPSGEWGEDRGGASLPLLTSGI
jgi:hypothetical protein